MTERQDEEQQEETEMKSTTTTGRPQMFDHDWERPVWYTDGQPMNEEATYIEEMEKYAQALEVAAQPDTTALLAKAVEALEWGIGEFRRFAEHKMGCAKWGPSASIGSPCTCGAEGAVSKAKALLAELKAALGREPS